MHGKENSFMFSALSLRQITLTTIFIKPQMKVNKFKIFKYLLLFPTFGSKIASHLFRTCSWFVRRILRGHLKISTQAWENHQKQSNHRLPHSICFRLHFSGVTLWFRTLSAMRRAREGSANTAPFHTGQ